MIRVRARARVRVSVARGRRIESNDACGAGDLVRGRRSAVRVGRLLPPVAARAATPPPRSRAPGVLGVGC